MKALAIASILALAGVATAATFGTVHEYEIAGFTADSKHVFFEKKSHGQGWSERWLAVYDATSGKLKSSKPTYRDDYEKPNISDKVGEKTIAQMHAKFTAPVAATKLAPKSPLDEALAFREVAKGHAQTFTGTDVEVRTLVKLRGKLKPHEEINDGGRHSAGFDVEVTLVTKGDTRKATRRLYANIVDTAQNGNVSQWPELYVKEVAVAPNSQAVAIVFARKPTVIPLPAKAAKP